MGTEERTMTPFVKKTADIIGRLEERFCVNIANEADTIQETTELVKF